jgi:intracellular sulfur oxidation DsrE/DsrF family protein
MTNLFDTSRFRPLTGAAAFFIALTFLAGAFGAKAAEPQPTLKGHGKLVLALTTGMEDMQTLNMALRHAKMAKESGYLADVVLLVYGRAIMAFNGAMGQSGRPPQIAAMAREAQHAGVRIVHCRNSIEQMGIPMDKIDPKPDEFVPLGIVKLSELISQGYQAIRY